MGRKNFNTFLKHQKEEKKRKKKAEKQAIKDARKAEPTSSSLDDMIAYVDSYGNIVSEKPEEPKPAKKDPKKDTEES